jgi:hypothetical protein
VSLYVAGLDLGQARDYSALCVVEATPTRHQFDVEGTEPELRLPIDRRVTVEGPPVALALRGLERYELATPYPKVVEHVAGRVRALPGRRILGVDATGVGAAVVDMFTAIGVPLAAVTITGGDAVQAEGHHWRVPKRDLVHALLVALQQGRFTYATRLALAPTLVQELTAFQLKITAATGHDTYEAWREGAHDDLVLAVAIASWLAELAVQGAYAAEVGELTSDEFNEDIRVRIGPNY